MTATAEATTNWQDCPRYHTNAATMANKLRLVAAALDELGDTEFAQTWLDVSMQVTGDDNPVGRKAAVDMIADALALAPAQGGRHSQYTAVANSVTVYTGALRSSGCCEHCVVGA